MKVGKYNRMVVSKMNVYNYLNEFDQLNQNEFHSRNY